MVGGLSSRHHRSVSLLVPRYGPRCFRWLYQLRVLLCCAVLCECASRFLSCPIPLRKLLFFPRRNSLCAKLSQNLHQQP